MTVPNNLAKLLERAYKDLSKEKTYVTCSKCKRKIRKEYTANYITEFHYKSFLLFWGRIVTIHKCYNCWD